MADRHTSIAIIGAGPTGLTLGCQLMRLGAACRLFDQAPRATPHSRAIGISARTLEVFAAFGAEQGFLDLGHKISRANFYSGARRIGSLTTSSVHGTRFPFTLALPQSETERLLRERFIALGGTIESDRKLVGLDAGDGRSPVQLSLAGADGTLQVESDWVVGADGHQSRVREFARIGFPNEVVEVTFTIVDAFVKDGPARGEGHYFFSPEGMLVVIPLPDGSHRFAATVRADGAADEPLTIDSLRQLVAARVPGSMDILELRDAGWGGSRVRIRPRIASTLRSGRCFLAGDAAHVFSPVGGQGMNSGVQDAQNLAWKLALVSTGRASPDLLGSYEAERLPVAHALMKASLAQTRLGTMTSRAGRLARDLFLSFASKTGRLDRKMAPVLTQLAIDYSRSSAASSSKQQKADPTGRRVPDAPLTGAGGQENSEGARRLFEILGRRPFTILALVADPSELELVRAIQNRAVERNDELVHVSTIWRQGSRAVGSVDSMLTDADGALAIFSNTREATALLVRPDGHLALRARLVDWQSVFDHLCALLDGPGSRIVNRAGVKTAVLDAARFNS